uniref:Uncharacterized protein n=1 Tax=Ascaris lumbricoides TaxID=6252 RepID=A0A9J2PYZ6_ASCLU
MLSHDGAVILTSCHEYVALENSMANIHNASSSASARAIYVCTIRKETDKGSPTVLVMAKSRISPIEYLPLHRFELLGVLNEARSFQFVRKQLPLNDTGDINKDDFPSMNRFRETIANLVRCTFISAILQEKEQS